jgi:hypothetical protein
MSLLLYDQYGKHIDFSKMKQGRTVFHTNLNYIDQVCGDYLVSFKNDFSKGYIENDYTQNIETPFRKAIPLQLPKMIISIDFIAIYMSPGSKVLLVVLTPNLD